MKQNQRKQQNINKYSMKKQALLFLLFITFLSVNLFAEESPKLITLESDHLSLILKVDANKQVTFEYFGKKITDTQPFLKKKSYRRTDHANDPQAYSAFGGRDFREPALEVTHADGNITTELIYQSHEIKKEDNQSVLKLNLCDKAYPLNVTLTYYVYPKEDVFKESVSIQNKEKKEVILHRFFSCFLPIRAQKYYLTHFAGAWAKEMQKEETLLTHGTKSIQTLKGVRTTHTENPSFMLSLNQPLNEDAGEVIAGALAWSGNFKLNFELDELNTLNIMAGINPEVSAYTLKSGESFQTPEMIFTFSYQGAGQATRNLHDWARNFQIYDPLSIRPTLLNSWEGAYFKFNEKTLTDMMDRAADMGLEMFVLDDGWFGNEYPRNNDKQGLGDWQVNKEKLPHGIDYLASYAQSKGLKFGIWIEPEMVNPNSVLAKQHPEWIVKGKGRDIPQIRKQWLLDLTNPKVQDYVMKIVDDIMSSSDKISYIKWDCNRHVESVGSTYLSDKQQQEFWIRYTQGLYNVYERVRAKYPKLIMQACASGGGRVDYGALKYHQEIWTSDNTDALSRIKIQYGTNMIYPALVTGSHVSASPNHQTGNQTPLKFRFDLAMSGRLGMELEPKTLNDKEKAFARKAIQNYKNIRELITSGDLYRIRSPYEGGVYSLMYVAKNKQRAVFYAYNITYEGRVNLPSFRLKGLDPKKKYTIHELNTDKPRFWGEGESFSGEYLMNVGLNLLLQKCFDSMVFTLEEAN